MLSLMAKGFYADSPLIFFPIVGLVIFMTVFTGLALSALRKKKSDLEALAALPLRNDDKQVSR